MISSLTDTWVQNYRKNHFKKYQELPNAKWNRIGYEHIANPQSVDAFHVDIQWQNASDEEQISILGISEKLTQDKLFRKYTQSDIPFGVGEKLVSMAESLFNTGVVVHAPKNHRMAAPVTLSFHAQPDAPIILDQNILVAEANSVLSVVMDYDSSDSFEAFHNGLTRVYCGENAVVNLIKIQRMSDQSVHFDSNLVVVGNYGKFNLIHVELGSQMSGLNYTAHMNGVGAELNQSTIYFLDKDRKMDLGFSMHHNHPHTLSQLEVIGGVKDTARKVFRGDLHFKNGSKSSKGSESESVVVLSDDVKLDSIPALFCYEDDVVGQHAASVGKIDESKLFYLMSRGFTEKEARRIMVEASFMPVVDKLPSKYLKELVQQEIRNRIS
jgi:Fe-S cluster assembly protein SufD